MEPKGFFENLRQIFATPTAAPLPEPDEKLALGALMVRVALSDNVYRVSEISRIDRLLARFYDLTPIEAAKMRATCEKLEKQAPDGTEFAALIRETVSRGARIDALEALWEVVLADGERRPEELDMLETLRVSLGLTEDEASSARNLAEHMQEQR